MIKKLRYLCTLLLIAVASITKAETVTFTFSELATANSWENGTAYTSVEISPITLSAAGGGNNGKYYTSDKSWRMYNGGTVNITAAEGYKVTVVSSTPSQTFTISDGAASLSCTATTKFTSITVTYSSVAANQVSIPTFSKASGAYVGSQSVTIACATDGATIYYTTDGTEPTALSKEYEGAINISTTTTIKAIAVKSGMNNSDIATATYVILQHAGTEADPYTVADARDAVDAGVGVTGVYATGIVSEIPTAWSTHYNNITFNFIDEEGGSDFLQAFRCESTTGVDASKVTVGDIVVVKGNLKLFNDTYEFDASCQLVSLTHPAVAVEAPTFSPTAGTYSSAQNVTISCATDGATIYYTTDDTEPTSASTEYTGAISVSTTTTIKAIAIKGTDESSVATATYTITALSTIAEVRAQGTGSVFTKGVVTSCVGTTGYIQDATAAICVYGKSLNVGDEITVSGTLSTYKGLLEITNPIVNVLSSDNTVTPTVKTIAEINDDVYTSNSSIQGLYVTIENATVTAINDQNTTIAQENNTIVVRGISEVEYSVNDILTLNGNIGCFDGAQIANPQNVEVQKNGNTVINASDVNLAYNATSSEIAYTIDNPVEGTSLTASTDATWLTLGEVGTSSIPFTCSTNEGNADRIATITLTYGEVTKDVTVTQSHHVVDYATLPFEFDEGKADIENTTGLTQEGLGSDYGSSPKLKFDHTGDYLILHFDGTPGTLTFDIKGNSFSDGTFKVQTSEDGLTYTDLETYTELGATQNKVFDNLGENVRYIKWIYTEKVNGNVALGNIRLEKPGQVSPPVISANNVTIAADATSGEISYSIANPVDGVGLTATTDAEWIRNIAVSSEKITFTTTANAGDTDRKATFTLSYEGAEDKEVTVTQKHFVADIAELPFEFDGGRADIANTAGLTHEGLDTDYDSSPKLKFNTTGDYLLLHFNGQPGKLTFAIKGNSFSGGTFKVQTSADGETFTDLETYTTLNETQSEEFINLSADARYIKWIYTEKVSGNVALGLIKLEKPSNDPIISAEDVTIEANATSGEIAYTITNPIGGTTLLASTDTEWISIPDNAVSADKVTFTTTINTGAERTGVIKLTYGSVTKEVNVKQKRSVISGNVRYELVNSTDGLTDGQYLIVSSLGEFAVAFDGSLETLDAVGNNKLVTVTNNVIMATDDISFTINVTDGTIKSASGYYIGVSSNSNGLKQTDEAGTYKNAFSIADGNASITALFEGSTMSLRYNKTSGQDRFRYYKDDTNGNPTQEAIQLFKKVASTEVKPGDVNGDTKVDIADVTKLVNLLLNESESHNPADYPAADLDGDEDLDAEDVRALVEKVLSEE